MKWIFFWACLLGILSLINSTSLISSELRSASEARQQPTPNRPSAQPNRRSTTKPLPDSTKPGNRRQPRLRPDSLRRGGATRIDTVRR
ncbi:MULTISPECIES: hypothetical protein [unclassified Spirosoma]|uniref:hypothetical protein n=1 Tax=unclassified Spirosoma TaxID=2621999 RepID=UPI001AC25814|nr:MULTISPECIES: hypothetical protein [unclassified Spirosoma]MBN8823444.1 hypothetical protein [Spirosoma sp.]